MTVTPSLRASITASIPSPSRGVVHLGPIPLRGYAFAIVLGILAAVAITERRLARRGGRPGDVGDVVLWAVPFGIVGARLYHVVTTPELYFGHGGHLVDALKIWRGGLGIWGAVALGALGAGIGCRRRGLRFLDFADAAAPGLAVAQAVGRWGNWFNQELYGRRTSLPWALHITRSDEGRVPGYYHPTFLYESLWDLGVAALCIWAGRRYGLRRGRVFALYVAAYTAGRFWIEALRIDDAHHIFGLRLNDWVSIIVFAAAVAVLLRGRGRPQPGAHDGVGDGVPDDTTAALGHAGPADPTVGASAGSGSAGRLDAADRPVERRPPSP